MLGSVLTAGLFGIDAFPVECEADLSNGLPSFDLVGFLSSEVREARERVRSALHNSDISLPPSRLTINLSPANRRKAGNSFDLPIAVCVLTAAGLLTQKQVDPYLFSGELGLDGSVKPVNGAISLCACAKACGRKAVILPAENAAEGAASQTLPVYGVRSLTDVLRFLKDPHLYAPVSPEDYPSLPADVPDFSDVIGQPGAVRAAEIAAAGMHNLLFSGPPGIGKSMIAKRLPGILPPITLSEQIEITKIYSVRGLTRGGLMTHRPFRSPHHTISPYALAGGGAVPQPGEISLSHRGVLFLDELPEFNKSALEVMRQPMEDGEVLISRTSGVYRFPARFMLAAAMNPCPCGYYPDRKRCRCTDADILRYQGRISRPLMDRIDLRVTLSSLNYRSMEEGPHAEASSVIRERVTAAAERQRARSGGKPVFNASLTGQALEEAVSLTPEARSTLRALYGANPHSMRSHHKLLRIARTIADLEDRQTIGDAELSEAWFLRNTGVPGNEGGEER